MILKYITCSGANEHTNIDDLLALAKEYPMMEIGIQVSDKKVMENPARFDWIAALHEKVVAQKLAPNIAMHVNGNWVQQFASRAMIPELDYFLNLCNGRKRWLVKRLQINFLIDNDYRIEFGRFCQAMTDCAARPIVLPYNEKNAVFIHRLHDKSMKFDCLYDSSHGEGVLPQQLQAPVFKDRLQGYSGGLSAENVAEQLQKLSHVVKPKCVIYIDAEGKLKGNDGHLDLQKCKAYIENALSAVK